jgi:hypothetical protein
MVGTEWDVIKCTSYRTLSKLSSGFVRCTLPLQVQYWKCLFIMLLSEMIVCIYVLNIMRNRTQAAQRLLFLLGTSERAV